MSTTVRIYKPAKTAMQSGRGNTRRWVMDFEPTEKKVADGLMGWTGSGDMNTQLKLSFPTKEDAVSYAKRKGYDYRVREPNERGLTPKSYAENFAYRKVS